MRTGGESALGAIYAANCRIIGALLPMVAQPEYICRWCLCACRTAMRRIPRRDNDTGLPIFHRDGKTATISVFESRTGIIDKRQTGCGVDI